MPAHYKKIVPHLCTCGKKANYEVYNNYEIFVAYTCLICAIKYVGSLIAANAREARRNGRSRSKKSDFN